MVEMGKKFIFYVADMVSLQSGAGDVVHVREFIKELCKKGFRVTLLIKGKTLNIDKNNNLTVKTVKPVFNRFPGSVFTYLVSFIQMAIIALTNKVQFIYARDNGLNLGVIIGKILRIPVFLEINGDLTIEYSGLRVVLVRFLTKITYPLADGLIIPSKNQMSLLLSCGIKKEKIFNIPNGVDPLLFRPIEKNFCRKKLGLNDSLYFCFIGNLVLWQGIENAIIALSNLIRDQPNINVKLIIVGDGPVRKKLEDLAQKLHIERNILFLGTVPHKLIPYVINASDICVAPFTAWRNKKIGISPLKLFEYLSCGKPVITSLIPGTEIIQNLNAGILVEPDNVDDLKNAFTSAINKLPLWEKKAKSLHQELARNHSWECRVDDVLEILSQLISDRGG